jgi:4-diphosphocytidyl-2-C-methyl-D-erythritol kinase
MGGLGEGGHVIVIAYSKLTLSLRVLGSRPDGFHELEALTVSLSNPCDSLRIEPADEMSISVSGLFAPDVPTDSSNLAWRAAEAVGQTLAISIGKEIPPGAGLGGGSADAAAVLVACGGTEEMGAALGSDVPFCMRGGAAWMRGRGEIIEPTTVPKLELLVIAPDFGCSTPAVYRAWDELGGPSGRVVEIDGFPPLVNDLEPAAERVEPRLRAFREQIEAVTGGPALLAGSGSAYVVPWREGLPSHISAPVVCRAMTMDWGVYPVPDAKRPPR